MTGAAEVTLGTAEALRRLAVERDGEAWAALLHSHGAEILRLACSITRDRALAEDVCQQTLLKVRDDASRFRPSAETELDVEVAARAWIMRIASNTALKMLRSRRRAQQREHFRRVSAHASDEGLLAQLQEEVTRLPEPLRLPIVLRFFAGLDYARVAAELRLSEDAARKRISRALGELRRRLATSGSALSLTAVPQLLAKCAEAGAPPLSLPPQFLTRWQALLNSPEKAVCVTVKQGGLSVMAKLSLSAAAFIVVALVATTLPSVQTGEAAPVPAPPATLMQHRWIYLSYNFMRQEQVDSCIKIIERAAKAGYTNLAVTDCKFSRWDEAVTVRRPEYDNNVKKVRQAARDHKLQFHVFCGEQGSELLSVDPNLAEGMPVIDAPFVVKNGELVPADTELQVQNGGFEAFRRDTIPAAWSNIDDLDKIAFIDTEVKHEGKQSLRLQDIKNSSCGNGRAIQGNLKCKPFRYYHLSVMLKTENFDAPQTINILALGKQALDHQHFDVKATQDWTRYDIVFNTLDNQEVGIYIGSWGGRNGKLWIDDVKLEPGGFVNLLRRPSLTFKLTSADGKTAYIEGKDFSPVKDPKMGNTRWPGLYEQWYEQPKVTIPQGSALKEGDKVLASYSHAMNTLGYGVFACMAEPKVQALLKRNIEQLRDVLQPDGYVLTHDEIRHQGWDESCQKDGRPLARRLTANINDCAALVRKLDPGKPIAIWSDMVDPNHNAGKNGRYYLVKGSDPWYGAWEGLDKDLTIINWNSNPKSRVKTLKHFADLGYKQILAGYYDAPSENVLPWLTDATPIQGVCGVMYTTWGSNFGELEKFSKLVQEFKK